MSLNEKKEIFNDPINEHYVWMVQWKITKQLSRNHGPKK